MRLADYTDDELREELSRRRAAACTCGCARREITERTKGFYPRTGCLTCNNWDDKPRLDGSPTI